MCPHDPGGFWVREPPEAFPVPEGFEPRSVLAGGEWSEILWWNEPANGGSRRTSWISTRHAPVLRHPPLTVE